MAIKNGQTPLEANAIEKRGVQILKNDYTRNEEYNERHADALADGDALGKGTGNGGHTHIIPDSTLPKTMYNYGDIDTTDSAGGKYDKEGRNGVGGRDFLKNINLYGPENPYGLNLIDTSLNELEGQVIIK